MRGLGCVLVAVLTVATVDVVQAQTADRKPPVFRHTPLLSVTEGEEIVISTEIRDESKIFAPLVWFRLPGAESYTSVDLVQQPDETFKAKLPVKVAVEYWLEAYDVHGNGPARAGTPEKPFSLIVTAPTAPALNTLVALGAPTESDSADKGELLPVESNALVATPVESNDAHEAARSQMTEAEWLAALMRPADVPQITLREMPPAPEIELPNSVVLLPGDLQSGKGKSSDDLDPNATKAGEKPIYKRWWFVGGAGVVAAAAVGGVLVYALMPNTVEQNVFSPTMRRP